MKNDIWFWCCISTLFSTHLFVSSEDITNAVQNRNEFRKPKRIWRARKKRQIYPQEPNNELSDYQLYDDLESEYYDQIREELTRFLSESQNRTKAAQPSKSSRLKHLALKVFGIIVGCIFGFIFILWLLYRISFCCCPWCHISSFRDRVYQVIEEWVPGVYVHDGEMVRYPPTKEEIDALEELKSALRHMMKP